MPNSIVAQKIDAGWEWMLKRNCSISPYQLAGIFLFLAFVSLVIGLGFYFMGATLILPYSCLEIVILFTAFFYYAKHANDYERLVLKPNVIMFENKAGHLFKSVQLNRAFAKIELPSHQKDLILITQGAQKFHFGSHIHSNLRSHLGREIMLKL
jgi:uncharacterized membrane protein